MKYAILVPDGMADLPLEELNDCTCMESANIPNMDMVARRGIVGTVKNVPRGMTPASDVANLSILGYDPRKYYCGRGPLEAANLNVNLEPNDVAFRFNTVTVNEDKMEDYSAGHISTKESKLLVKLLTDKFGSKRYSFYPGTSYRNLLVVHCDSEKEAEEISKITCFAPHDILDKLITKHFPKSQELVELMLKSREVIADSDINKVRIDLGQNPANMIWVWGQGRKPVMPTFKEAFNKTGGMISAVDLLKGMARILGLEVAEVPGATGYYDTNYEGKAEAAIEILKRKDFVFLHVEAPDEAGHNGDIRAKIAAIENFDSKIVGRIVKEFTDSGEDFRVLILPDHPTPIKKRTHTAEAVPFAMAGKDIVPDDVSVFTEKSAKAGSKHLNNGAELIKLLFNE